MLVMIPVIIQQLINTLFNMVDNVMVGSLNGISMSAVTVANKPYLIYSGVFFGVTGAGGLMISQFYGAKRYDQCQRLFSLEFLICFTASVICCLALYCFPETIMRLFVQDAQTIALGVEYLQVICFSYVPVAVSNTCMFSMRSLGRNKMPMVASMLTMALNALFNYGFIFGNFGLPAMGVRGAALGTLLARLCEMFFYLFVLLRCKAFFSMDFLAALRLPRNTLKSFVKRALPLTGNELLWTLGLNIFFWCYARLDEPALPAITISEQVMNIGMVLSVGMASAISVMVGTALGANELQKAKQHAKYLFSMVCVIALTCAGITLIAAQFLPRVFNVSAELRGLSTLLTCIYALFFLPNCIYSACFFCLRAGGDTKHAMLLDSIYMWLIPIPFCLAAGIWGVGKIPLLTAFILIQILSNSKSIPAAIVVR